MALRGRGLHAWRGSGGCSASAALCRAHPLTPAIPARSKCWGYNWHGQLGLGDTKHRGDDATEMGDRLPAVDLGVGRTAVQLATGGDHTCVLLDNGQLYAPRSVPLPWMGCVRLA